VSDRLLAPLDQRQVWQRYAKASGSGCVTDPLAREVDQRMRERLDYVALNPNRVLDLGCGHGDSLDALKTRFPDATVTALDAVPSMLPRPDASPLLQKWVSMLRGQGRSSPLILTADARQLPIANQSHQLVWANFLLPWVDDYSAVFGEARRVLSNEGLFMFSTLGPDTLKELAACFDDPETRRHDFPDMHDLGDLLGEVGFADPVVDMEVLTVQYGSLDSLLEDLTAAGAGSAHIDRRKGLTGRQAWQRVRERWQAQSRTDGTVGVSFEIIYGHAWRVPPKHAVDGRAIINFMDRPAA
jgi:malonyl-CoA O-methyltransferase